MKKKTKAPKHGNPNVSLYVPAELKARIRRYQAKVGVTLAELTRRALVAYLDEQEKRYGA